MNMSDLPDAPLPALCYAVLEEREPGKRIILIKSNEPGYYQTDCECGGLPIAQLRGVVEKMNARLGVSPAQAEAMLAGSMFGWDVPGACPSAYARQLQ